MLGQGFFFSPGPLFPKAGTAKKSQQYRAAVICSTKYACRLSILNLKCLGPEVF